MSYHSSSMAAGRTAEPGPLPAEQASPFRLRLVRGWWSIYLLLLPLYLGPSGYPQISHVYLAATAPLVLLALSLQIRIGREVVIAGLALLTYVACVNSYWFSQYEDRFFMMTIFYFLFNYAIVLLIVALFGCDPVGMARVTRAALFLCLVGEAIFVLIVGDRGWGRALGTFNDPNQMGYWTLLTVTMIFALREERALNLFQVVALLLAGFIIFTSVSRAALLGYGVLLMLVLVFSQVKLRVVLAIAVVAAAGFLIVNIADVKSFGQMADIYAFMEARFSSRDTTNDSLADRGYGRLVAFPEYLFFGAGEGGYTLRFGLANETHSTIGAILFGYGVFGFTLFALLLFVLLRRASWFHLSLILPAMAYGIAQQGARFAMFWMLLAIIYSLSTTRKHPDDVVPPAPTR